MSKSYLADGLTKDIVIDGETITIKKFSYGTQKKIMVLVDTKSPDTMDVGLEESIIKWTLTDNDNNALTINRDTFDKLTAEFVEKIYTALFAFNNIKPAELKK